MSARKWSLGFLFLASLSGCAGDASEEASEPMAVAKRYRYESGRGCLDAQGRPGLNPLNAAVLLAPDAQTAEGSLVLSNRDAECVDFRGFAFEPYLGLSYAELRGWNLRGADLSGAKFFFANWLDADLRGTKLRDLNFGYARIEGIVDAQTTLPTNQSCEVVSNRLKCRL